MIQATSTPFWLKSVYKLVDDRAYQHVILVITKMLTKRRWLCEQELVCNTTNSECVRVKGFFFLVLKCYFAYVYTDFCPLEEAVCQALSFAGDSGVLLTVISDDFTAWPN